jgi:hypothetical protein
MNKCDVTFEEVTLEDAMEKMFGINRLKNEARESLQNSGLSDEEIEDLLNPEFVINNEKED